MSNLCYNKSIMEGKKSQQLSQPRAILVFGAPASGKTTFCEKFSQQFRAPYYNLNEIAEDQDFTREKVLYVLDLIARSGQNLIIEGMLNTEEERYQLLESYGINDVVEIDFTPEIASLSTYDFSKRYLLELLNIKGLVLGYDNMFGNKKINDFQRIYELGKNYNFTIFEASSYIYNDIHVSSTQIRNALNAGKIELIGKTKSLSVSNMIFIITCPPLKRSNHSYYISIVSFCQSLRDFLLK